MPFDDNKDLMEKGSVELMIINKRHLSGKSRGQEEEKGWKIIIGIRLHLILSKYLK